MKLGQIRIDQFSDAYVAVELYNSVVAQRDHLLLHIHGNEHSVPFAGCPRCAELLAENPADDE